MIFTTNAELLCVIFLCGMKEVVHSQFGRCAGDQCFALFQTAQDFTGAQASCRHAEGGKLFVYNMEEMSKILQIVPRVPGGRYWLSGGPAEEAAAGVQTCSSISLRTDRTGVLSSSPCRDKLDGFVCQYAVSTPCGELRADGDARVTYTAMGAQVLGSDKFPPGSFAVTAKAASSYMESKHVCLDDWLQAPWSCEVFQGGCEHACITNNTLPTCVCPPRRTLHDNKITCSTDPCAKCTQGCRREGDAFRCTCNKGYRLAPDEQTCVDVDECVEMVPCTAEGEVCHNTVGDFECSCTEGFAPDDGVCVNVSICDKCEHMLCEKVDGVYECVCRKGYTVSAQDPTRCEMHCTEKDCLAFCVPNRDNNKPDMQQCFCPEGYILNNMIDPPICTDIDECESNQCDHHCENVFGSYNCRCNQGYRPHEKDRCVPITDEDEDDDGSGSTLPMPTAAGSHPESVPNYIKTGSVLGISMFLMLCGGLIFLLVQYMAKRCGKLELPQLKHQNIDVFYLQQVTTDTYKRLSFDKQFKNDSHIL